MSEATELLAAAAHATRAAAKLLAGVRPEAIRAKDSPTDLVTEWDLRAEDCIRAALAETTPGIPVLGEEGGEHTSALAEARSPKPEAHSSLRWVVDPIDGTVNFAHGLPIWAISIACERIGDGVLAGVVFAPVLGWWFEASRGGGARDETGAPLRVSHHTKVASSLLSTGFPYDRATSKQNNFAEWEHLQRRAGACRRLGAASLDLCLVARGWLEGYWERHLKAWTSRRARWSWSRRAVA